METLFQDVRYALRRLLLQPTFSAVAVFTLALGIGANTAVFSLADLIIRRPVDLPEMDRLAVVDEQAPGSEDTGISPANYLDLRAESTSFDALAAYEYWSASETDLSQPRELQGVRVSRDFFSAVDVKPALGRTFGVQDDSSQNDQVVISNSLWKQRFGSDVSIVGKTIQLDGHPFTVIGVLPARATFPLGAPAFWIPLVMDSRTRSERTQLSLHSVGRLSSTATMAQARAEIENIWKQLATSYPDANRNHTLQLVSLHDHIVLDYNRQFALMLTGVVGLVLLIACTNISAVQFASAAKRRSEIAVRAALGASRRLLFRQLLVENMLLALVGGGFGILFAIFGVAVLRRTLPDDVRWFCDVESLAVNTAGLLFTAAIAIGAGLFFGLAPAWRSSKAEIGNVLAEGTARISGHRTYFWRAALIVTETAMATVLLITAGLMTKGFALLAGGQPGLAPSSLLTFHITLPRERYPKSQQISAFHRRLLDQLQALPNVRSAALASGVPYSFFENNSELVVRGSRLPEPGQGPVAMVDSVSTEYFRSMQIPLRSGRAFNSSDTGVGLPVCIVSQSMANRLWPGQSAVGQQVRLATSSSNDWITVVGIAADVQHEIYDRSFRSILYVPNEQDPPPSADFVIRGDGDPLQFAAAMRARVQELDAAVPVENLQTLGSLVRSQASSLQYVAGLMSVFAVLGLILACVGVYGVMANSVAERWRELAIRMALGARSWTLLLTVIGRALLFSTIGMATGLLLALGLARLLSSLIYGVSAWDAGTFLSIPLLLAAVALLACYAPAHRAIRMDPMAALRYE